MLASVVNYRTHLRQSCKSRAASPSIFRIYFQVPYPATPLPATLTKTAGVCTNNSQLGTTSLFSFNLQLSILNFRMPYPLSSHALALFCILLHFLALTQNSTLLFSNASALFAKKHRGGGISARSEEGQKGVC
jgi:hypothetical protein